MRLSPYKWIDAVSTGVGKLAKKKKVGYYKSKLISSCCLALDLSCPSTFHQFESLHQMLASCSWTFPASRIGNQINFSLI
jgi:hypothetical protein